MACSLSRRIITAGQVFNRYHRHSHVLCTSSYQQCIPNIHSTADTRRLPYISQGRAMGSVVSDKVHLRPHASLNDMMLCQQTRSLHDSQNISEKQVEDGVTSQNIDMISQDLLQGIMEKLPDRASLSNVRKVVLLLQEYKFSATHIKDLFEAFPELSELDKTQLKQVLSLFRDLGFRPADLVDLFYQRPPFLLKPVSSSLTSTVTGVLDALVGVGFVRGDANGSALIASHPGVLELSKSQISARYAELMSNFHRKDVYKLVMQSPAILTDPWSLIAKRIEYVREEMALDHRSMVKSNMFSHDYLHLRTRHQLLDRMGLYVRPDKNDVLPPGFIPLKTIVDTPDKHFANRVAGISLAEYAAFQQMMEEEVAAEDDMESATDDDSEDDEGDENDI